MVTIRMFVCNNIRRFVSRECAGVALEPAGDGETISRQVYCGWLRSDCIFIAGSDPPKTVEVMKVPSSLNTRDRAPDLIREFPSALFDWRDTTTAPEPKLNVAIHVNNTQVRSKHPRVAQSDETADESDAWCVMTSLAAPAVSADPEDRRRAELRGQGTLQRRAMEPGHQHGHQRTPAGGE